MIVLEHLSLFFVTFLHAVQIFTLFLRGLMCRSSARTKKYGFRQGRTPNIPTGSASYCSRMSPTPLMHARRQTVFYTPEAITVGEGDELTGTLTCAPNARNNRDLDITIAYECGDVQNTVDYKMCVFLSFCTAFSPRVA
jgi:hypothetical protein